ncbi:MAG TPA: Gfo/Idh/MocA family oxidoreductase [Thermoplasmata archaeon]|nr:Gfo/Idh/MocA family oxidoreductase [Thermoplasmata archaeon]
MKVGVIGVGSMGQNHARVYAEIADLMGIADPDVKAGGALLERLPVRNYFPDYRSLLKEDVDAVSICVPTGLHAKIALDTIRAGVNLLVEKPLAPTVAAAKKIVEAADRAGVTLAVGHVERHNPAIALVKRQLEAGDYGNLITVSARRVSSFPTRVRDIGVILDLGVHDIDVMRYLVDSPVRDVFALSGRRLHERFEDHANILLRFEDGVHGFLEVNWLTPTKVRHLALTCQKSFVEVDYTDQSVTVSSSTLGELDSFNLYQIPLENHVRRIHVRKEEPLRRELVDFLAAAKAHRAPLVTGQDAIETLRVVEAAMLSHRLRRAVALGRAARRKAAAAS